MQTEGTYNYEKLKEVNEMVKTRKLGFFHEP